MKGLFSLLNECKYPSLDRLTYSIFDRLENELIEIENKVESGEYTNEQIVEMIENLRKKIVAS